MRLRCRCCCCCHCCCFHGCRLCCCRCRPQARPACNAARRHARLPKVSQHHQLLWRNRCRRRLARAWSSLTSGSTRSAREPSSTCLRVACTRARTSCCCLVPPVEAPPPPLPPRAAAATTSGRPCRRACRDEGTLLVHGRACRAAQEAAIGAEPLAARGCAERSAQAVAAVIALWVGLRPLDCSFPPAMVPPAARDALGCESCWSYHVRNCRQCALIQ